MKKLAWIALVFGLIITGFNEPAFAQDKKLTPAQRRAAIRDSLRQVRLERRREAANKQQQQKVDQQNKQQKDKKANNQTANTPASQQKPSNPAAKKTAAKKTFVSAKDVVLPIPDSIIVDGLTLRNTEVRDVLAGLAAQYGINIIVDKNVKGPISINLAKIPLKDAIKLIAEENGYMLSVKHGAIKVELPPPPEPEKPPEKKLVVEFKDGKLTLDFDHVPIEKVVRKLIDLTGKTIVLGEGAHGNVKAYYKNVVFEKAFKLLVESNGFRYRDRDDVLTIYKDGWAASGDGKKGAGKGNIYVQEGKVTLEVVNMPLSQVISSITSQAGLSTVIYGQITGNVTAKLSNILITDVFQYLFKATDFTFWLHKGIYFIGSKQMKAITNSKLIVLESMKADEIMDLIPPELIKDMKVKVVPSQNAIMSMGTYEAIQSLEDYIAKIDLPVPQILIEALVVDIDMDKIRNYGVDLFLGDAKKVAGQETFYPEFTTTLNKRASQSFLKMFGLDDIVSLPKDFVAKVEALEREKVLNIKSRPQIATLNGKTATLTVGQTQYFLLKQETDFNQTQNTTTRTQERFEKIQADVKLTVTPFVTGKGEITVEIIPDFSEPEGSFSSAVPPTINRRHLKSTVRLREGETIILGGLVKESLNSDRRQFPLLGSIPLVGWLFKNHNTTKSRSQLMIFVTPHIYYGADANVNVKNYLKKSKLP